MLELSIVNQTNGQYPDSQVYWSFGGQTESIAQQPLNRHVAGETTAQQQDPANYYQAAPANYYAEFWHQNAINGLAYGFPYDDDAGQSSDISVASPQYMVVAVGW